MKNNIIIFGAGHYGKCAYYRFKNKYKIICIIDNNAEKINKEIYDVPVVTFDKIALYYDENVDIIICSKYYPEMGEQLIKKEIKNYYVMMEGFLYKNSSDEIMLPVEIEKNDYYKKQSNMKTILYIQNIACVRTHKIAKLMKEAGYNVCLIYTMLPPINEYYEYKSIYDYIWGFTSVQGIISFINNSDFDIIHCSNEPDIIATVVQSTNKPVVFDTHDMQSMRGKLDANGFMLEYLANVNSDGNMYVTNGVRDIANKKFNLCDKPTYVLENVVYDQVDLEGCLKKISENDNEIHCVYEGGIVGNDKMSHKYFEKIWLKIVAEKVHIHFYSHQDPTYCKYLDSLSPYLHYEGNIGSTDLIKELTKYDCGLLLLNVTEQNKIYLEMASANKLYEYLNARLPIVVGNVKAYCEFVKKYDIGIQLDLDSDIRESLEMAKKIVIDKEFLRKNKLTIKSHKKELIKFYEKIISSHKICK